MTYDMYQNSQSQCCSCNQNKCSYGTRDELVNYYTSFGVMNQSCGGCGSNACGCWDSRAFVPVYFEECDDGGWDDCDPNWPDCDPEDPTCVPCFEDCDPLCDPLIDPDCIPCFEDCDPFCDPDYDPDCIPCDDDCDPFCDPDYDPDCIPCVDDPWGRGAAVSAQGKDVPSESRAINLNPQQRAASGRRKNSRTSGNTRAAGRARPRNRADYGSRVLITQPQALLPAHIADDTGAALFQHRLTPQEGPYTVRFRHENNCFASNTPGGDSNFWLHYCISFWNPGDAETSAKITMKRRGVTTGRAFRKRTWTRFLRTQFGAQLTLPGQSTKRVYVGRNGTSQPASPSASNDADGICTFVADEKKAARIAPNSSVDGVFEVQTNVPVIMTVFAYHDHAKTLSGAFHPLETANKVVRLRQ